MHPNMMILKNVDFCVESVIYCIKPNFIWPNFIVSFVQDELIHSNLVFKMKIKKCFKTKNNCNFRGPRKFMRISFLQVNVGLLYYVLFRKHKTTIY